MAASVDHNEGYSLDEELELLKAIYIHELAFGFELGSQVQERPSSISLLLHPSTADEGDKQYVCLTLVICLPDKYPNALPSIQIKNPRGLSDAHIESISSNLRELAESRLGSPMLYELIEYAKESLTDNNIPSCACAICLCHFQDSHSFTKTDCYHYFHSNCLARFIEFTLRKKEEDHEEDDENEVGCPMCRLRISYDMESLMAAPVDVSTTEEVHYKPDKEMKNLQRKMASLFNFQYQKGGIINIEQEKNKFLIGIKSVPQPQVTESCSAEDTVDNPEPIAESGSSSAGGCGTTASQTKPQRDLAKEPDKGGRSRDYRERPASGRGNARGRRRDRPWTGRNEGRWSERPRSNENKERTSNKSWKSRDGNTEKESTSWERKARQDGQEDRDAKIICVSGDKRESKFTGNNRENDRMDSIVAGSSGRQNKDCSRSNTRSVQNIERDRKSVDSRVGMALTGREKDNHREHGGDSKHREQAKRTKALSNLDQGRDHMRSNEKETAAHVQTADEQPSGDGRKGDIGVRKHTGKSHRDGEWQKMRQDKPVRKYFDTTNSKQQNEGRERKEGAKSASHMDGKEMVKGISTPCKTVSVSNGERDKKTGNDLIANCNSNDNTASRVQRSHDNGTRSSPVDWNSDDSSGSKRTRRGRSDRGKSAKGAENSDSPRERAGGQSEKEKQGSKGSLQKAKSVDQNRNTNKRSQEIGTGPKQEVPPAPQTAILNPTVGGGSGFSEKSIRPPPGLEMFVGDSGGGYSETKKPPPGFEGCTTSSVKPPPGFENTEWPVLGASNMITHKGVRNSKR